MIVLPVNIFTQTCMVASPDVMWDGEHQTTKKEKRRKGKELGKGQ